MNLPPTGRLLSWLRAWNEEHGGSADRVRVFGIDVQNPAGDGVCLREALEKVALPDAAQMAASIDVCPGAGFDSMTAAYSDATEGPILLGKAALPESRHDACDTSLNKVRQWIAANEASLVKAIGELQTRYLAVSLRSLRAENGVVYFQTRGSSESYEARDEGMAEVFQMMRDALAPSSRTVIFAHNAHSRARADELKGTGVFKSCGTWLGERLGSGYAPIGFVARRVAWDWPNEVGSGSWTAKSPTAVETLLYALGKDHLLVDLARATSGAGAVFEGGKAYEMGHAPTVGGVPLHHYRGLLYLESSEAADNTWVP